MPIQGPERPQEDSSLFLLTGGKQAVGAVKQALQDKEAWIREQAIQGCIRPYRTKTMIYGRSDRVESSARPMTRRPG